MLQTLLNTHYEICLKMFLKNKIHALNNITFPMLRIRHIIKNTYSFQKTPYIKWHSPFRRLFVSKNPYRFQYILQHKRFISFIPKSLRAFRILRYPKTLRGFSRLVVSKITLVIQQTIRLQKTLGLLKYSRIPSLLLVQIV